MNQLSERLSSRIMPEPMSGCWLWEGPLNARGYGVVHVRREGRDTTTTAHRVVYEEAVGPIEDGLVLDHLVCETRSCVNPAHLRPVTPYANTMRGVGVGAKNARKQRCPQGHEYDEANTRLYRGRRYCRKCGGLRPAEPVA